MGTAETTSPAERAAESLQTYQGGTRMKLAVRRTTLVVLIFTFILGGITLLPESASAYCRYCKYVFSWGFLCHDAGQGQSGYTICKSNACGSCCLKGDSCSVPGGGCIEVGGEIICEEYKDTP